MKKEEIVVRVDEIKNVKDREFEIDLFVEFVEYVAKRKDSLGEKARLVLTIKDFSFKSWQKNLKKAHKADEKKQRQIQRQKVLDRERK